MKSTGKPVCVAGASGLVGSNIVKAALGRGYEAPLGGFSQLDLRGRL